MDFEAGVLAGEFDRALSAWCGLGGHDDSVRVRYVARLLGERGVWSEVVERWGAADGQGDGRAACRIGWVLGERGDQAGSQRAFARAVQRDDLDALSREVRVHREAGRDIAGLTERYREAELRQRQADERVDERGDAEAAYRVGDWLIRQWRAFDSEQYSLSNSLRLGVATPQESERWLSTSPEEFAEAAELFRAGEVALRRAAERGSGDAAARLGRLAYDVHRDSDSDKKRGQRALPWYRRADELGHPAGTWWHGMILSKLGETDAADAALRRADARGNPNAATSLAWLLRHREPPDLDGAEAAYRRAAQIGYHERAWKDLANFLEQRGDLRGAEAAHHSAAHHNEQHAQWGLSRFYEDHPDLKPADPSPGRGA